MKKNNYNISKVIILLLITVLGSCTVNKQNNRSKKAYSNEYIIPVGGNTYLTSGNRTKDKVSSRGIARWADQESIISTYFKVNKAGAVMLELLLELSEEEAEIKVTMEGESKKVDIPSQAGSVDAGEFEINNPGYVRVDFQGVKGGGRNYATIKEVIVKSADSLNIVYVKDNESNRFYWGRRGPSVHLTYNLPQEQNFKWFYNEIVVPEGEDPIGSYFMANGFGEGYFGMQVNSEEERRVLFSVWSPFRTDDPSEIPEDQKIKLIEKGTDVYTGEFGNEGSGGQSYYRYNWKAGNTYSFLNAVEPDGKGNTVYTAWFFAPEVGEWKLIASFLRPKTDTWYKRPHSFLENFADSKGYIERKAFYQNQWARSAQGEWVELDGARFTGDDIARRGYRVDYAGGLEENRFFLRNGGFFNETVEIGSNFKRVKSNNPPEIDFQSLKARTGLIN
jgi:hypothetical protein